MNLEQLCQRAGQIFRGTVLSARVGTIEAGGGRIPTVTYRIQVDESFKGEFQTVKGRSIAEIRMVGKAAMTESGNQQLLPVLKDVPNLEVGKTYLLLTTRPSAVGLSTTVGLGQGAFRLYGKSGQEQAVNEFGNRGLFKETAKTARVTAASPAGAGPVPYAMLADRIRAIVGGR
ncbi:MAG: hypothetical protein M3N43_05090 [Actinomycetota bacterium]|nr:hypothetical protein [Actinomycetota bacterium]